MDNTYGDFRLPVTADNKLIGDVGPRHQIVEMDLGNEYWGQSRILNGQVEVGGVRFAALIHVSCAGGTVEAAAYGETATFLESLGLSSRQIAGLVLFDTTTMWSHPAPSASSITSWIAGRSPIG